MNKKQQTRAAAVARGDVENGTGADWFELSKHERRARAFLALSGARFSAVLVDDSASPDWNPNGGGCHCLYRCRIASGSGSMVVRFWGSVHDWQEGRRTVGVYDVLSCICKYEPGPFDDFASEMGYFPMNSGADYKRARKTWRGCLREFAGVCRVWPSEYERRMLEGIN